MAGCWFQWICRAHGQETRPKESSGLSGWRERVNNGEDLNGEDLIMDVTDRLKKVLDYLSGSSARRALHPSRTSRYFQSFEVLSRTRSCNVSRSNVTWMPLLAVRCGWSSATETRA